LKATKSFFVTPSCLIKVCTESASVGDAVIPLLKKWYSGFHRGGTWDQKSRGFNKEYSQPKILSKLMNLCDD
jgi:hypothetical protein